MKWRFWRWLFKGIEGKSGFSGFLNYFLILHIVIGVILSVLVDECLKDAAETVLLPLASIFIGLSFAWAGNAQALMQTDEIREASNFVADGLENYVYKFQLAILVILITLSLWGLAGLGVFKDIKYNYFNAYSVIEFLLYFMASITLRECWHVVLGSQAMLLMRHHMSNIDES